MIDVTMDRATLADALKYVQQAVGQRVTLPVLSHLLVETGDGAVTLSATDLEVGIRVTLPGEVRGEGRVLLPAKVVAKYVAKDTSVTVTLTTTEDGDRATLAGTGPVAGTFRTGVLDDFPALPAGGDVLGPVDAGLLATVAKVTSSDEARPILTGVQCAGGVAAATDSWRLARATFGPADHPLDGVIIPARTLGFVAKLDDVCAGAQPGQATFRGVLGQGPAKARRVCQVEVVTRLIEGSFPDHDRLWPTARTTVVQVGDVDVWVASIKQMQAVVSQVNTPLTITANGTVTLSMGSRDVGELTAQVPGSVVGDDECHDEVTVHLNPGFAAGVLGLVGDDVRMEVVDVLKPVVFAGDGPVQVLLMPMRVS